MLTSLRSLLDLRYVTAWLFFIWLHDRFRGGKIGERTEDQSSKSAELHGLTDGLYRDRSKPALPGCRHETTSLPASAAPRAFPIRAAVASRRFPPRRALRAYEAP